MEEQANSNFTPEFLLKRMVEQDTYIEKIKNSDRPFPRKQELIVQAAYQKAYFFGLLKAYKPGEILHESATI